MQRAFWRPICTMCVVCRSRRHPLASLTTSTSAALHSTSTAATVLSTSLHSLRHHSDVGGRCSAPRRWRLRPLLSPDSLLKPAAVLCVRRWSSQSAREDTGAQPHDVRTPVQSTPRSAEETAALFFARPLAERLAAGCVADFMHQAERGGLVVDDALTAPAVTYADGVGRRVMPLRRFVRSIPAVTRDDILRARCDVQTWIAQTTLLQLVHWEADGTVRTAGTLSTEDHTHSPSQERATPSYGPLVFVGLRVDLNPQRVLEARNGGSETKPQFTSATSNEPSVDVSSTASTSAASSTAAYTEDDSDGDGGRDAAPPQRSPAWVTMVLDMVVHVLEEKKTPVAVTPRYRVLSDVYLDMMREAAKSVQGSPQKQLAQELGYDEFSELVLHAPAAQSRFWTLADHYVAVRLPSEDQPPTFENPQPRVMSATAENNYGGWGAATAVPTKEDVYEVLKYVPVNWGNFGLLSIPPEVKRRHLRSSSPLQWFRRQPYYFELRDMNGTTEVRRSKLLHPEAHGMTLAEARQELELRIASGEANSLVPLGPDGNPLRDTASSEEKAIHKFFFRVCPAYFAPLSLIMQRYTKKNLNEATLLQMAKDLPGEFEVLQVRYTDIPLVRKRVGADSSRWRRGFVADLESRPEDVRGIMMLLNRMCPIWDRAEYIYVRLSPWEQQQIGGFAGMSTVLHRHPEIFRVGERFVCRVDSSDPLVQQEPEPAADDMLSRSYFREENPYISPLDVAKVLHYVAPENEPCTAAYLVDCASPAMRVALPPRVITIVQQFPRLFACKETAPGVFSVHKLKAPGTTAPAMGRPVSGTSTAGDTSAATMRASSTSATASTEVAGDGGDMTAEEAAAWELEAQLAEESTLSRPDVIAAVKELIPSAGVDSANLLLWASLNVQRAANHYYGGLLKMIEAEPTHFRVVDNHHSKMVHRVEQ